MKMYNYFIVVLIYATFSLLYSCDDSVINENGKTNQLLVINSQKNNIFEIKVQNSNIVLLNYSDQIIYYKIIEKETSTRIDLNPDYTKWNFIESNSTYFFPYAEITGFKAFSKEAWIIWVLGNNKLSNSQTVKL